ncbi:TM2 domain-containing protein [Alterisphingorhabdus coralli]|uniref:TM2 domain-containing protein n=1 Tax=Alterisphingorhabdus coralli TaxID=3071408 RepID=A0AA97F5R5_9SPHN|nr:TM2 domain-containing protein [Parasphingorhabdus sp. SCSIO 66989]WOE74726.1 TM2 domain-containing protein [Parasphingorhabdus sp. SCSIO 66989]
MRGKILGVDRETGKGQISGDDGERYQFDRADWRAEAPPAIGALVDFEAKGRDATSVFRLDAVATRPPVVNEKNKIVAALLAFFLGGLGAHKFYLGYSGAGLTMLLLSIFGMILLFIPTIVISFIALIEFIIYLVTSDGDFEERYVRNKRPWF